MPSCAGTVISTRCTHSMMQVQVRGDPIKLLTQVSQQAELVSGHKNVLCMKSIVPGRIAPRGELAGEHAFEVLPGDTGWCSSGGSGKGGGSGAQFLLVTDYCENGSLAIWIRKHNQLGLGQRQQHEPFPQDTALRLAEEVALGMAFLHAQDMVHQDLKPDNVLITADTRAMVGDFGLAECLRSNSSPVSGKIRGSSGAEDVEGAGDVEGAVDETLRATHRGGSRDYIAPECWASGTCTRASDVYAFGILLHKLFVQHNPRETYDWRAVLGGRPNREYDAAVQEAVSKGLRPTLPPEGGAAQLTEPLRTSLYGLMQRCWHKDPKIRPTFETVAEELQSMRVSHGADAAARRQLQSEQAGDTALGTTSQPSASPSPDPIVVTPKQPTPSKLSLKKVQSVLRELLDLAEEVNVLAAVEEAEKRLLPAATPPDIVPSGEAHAVEEKFTLQQRALRVLEMLDAVDRCR